jgi:hypothetical protein
MADPTSSAPDAVIALCDGLREWEALDGVYISDGPIPDDQRPPRLIVLGDIEFGAQNYSTIGGRTFSEEYAITASLAYLAAGMKDSTGVRVARAGAYGLFGEVMRCLFADPHLGLLVQSAVPSIDRDIRSLHDEGISVRLDFRINVKNELRR